MDSSIATVRLGQQDRESLVQHFIALDTQDRRLRFGASISDTGIREYVARIDFARDGLFAIHDASLRVVAAVHIAIDGAVAEMGLSVAAGHRGRGNGAALLERAVTFLRNRSVPHVFVHCLAENSAMVRLARRSGMRIVYSGGESDARLELEAPTVHSFVAEWLADQRARASLLRFRRPAAITP